jgi:hypothetical protein
VADCSAVAAIRGLEMGEQSRIHIHVTGKKEAGTASMQSISAKGLSSLSTQNHRSLRALPRRHRHRADRIFARRLDRMEHVASPAGDNNGTLVTSASPSSAPTLTITYDSMYTIQERDHGHTVSKSQSVSISRLVSWNPPPRV